MLCYGDIFKTIWKGLHGIKENSKQGYGLEKKAVRKRSRSTKNIGAVLEHMMILNNENQDRKCLREIKIRCYKKKRANKNNIWKKDKYS